MTLVNRQISPMEKCSFVCHLLVWPLGILYIAWVLLSDEQLVEWNVTYYPPKEWAVHFPVTLFLWFLAAPILYSAMNAMTVPPLSSTDILTDVYTRKLEGVRSTTADSSNSLLEICDLDPSTLMWHFPPNN